MSKRVLVGHCGVDSGMIMICDPCYFNDVMRFKPDKMISDGKKEIESGGNVERGAHWIKLGKHKKQMQNIVSDRDAFVKDLCDTHEPKEYGDGVLSPTRFGDGNFPVYATYDNEGNVKKLEIVF